MSFKVIIPCAGYGTRMNMELHQAKEMLIYPPEGTPIIDNALKVCKLLNAEPVVISRIEKLTFNKYLEQLGIKPLIIKPEGEWMDTVLSSKKQWGTHNLLVLPDTRWTPHEDVLLKMKWQLVDLKRSMSFALHNVPDPQKWCVKSDCGEFMLEKPQREDVSHWAFGLVGWENVYGETFFYNLGKTKAAILPSGAQFNKLDSFVDLTRGDYKLDKL